MIYIDRIYILWMRIYSVIRRKSEDALVELKDEAKAWFSGQISTSALLHGKPCGNTRESSEVLVRENWVVRKV